MSRKPIGEEIRDRVPRFLLSIAVAFLFWLISLMAPPLVGDITVPGINIPPYHRASWLIWATTTLIAVSFLVRALSDALVLADAGTELIVAFLGVKEERSLRRIARDAIYIILAILLAAVAAPFLADVPQVGGLLSTAVGLITLGIFLVLIYDVGRILYRVLEERAEDFADWLAELAERVRSRRRRI